MQRFKLENKVQTGSDQKNIVLQAMLSPTNNFKLHALKENLEPTLSQEVVTPPKNNYGVSPS